MNNQISLKAEISPNARIGKNCTIYPFVYIEDDVVIGDDCTIYPFVSIMNGTRMGNRNTIHQGTVIAANPQDFNFKGELTLVLIGDDNVIRENVVINKATHQEGTTIIGNNNFIMEGAHISHDTQIADGCVLGYGVKIAGDCLIGKSVIFSSSVIVNSGVNVGDQALLQAGTRISNDVPPYIIAGGNPVTYKGINHTVMKANGMDDKTRKHVVTAYRLLFNGQVSVYDTILQIKAQIPEGDQKQNIIRFLQESRAGIITKVI